MSMKWDDAKEQIRNSTDIVELVGSYLTLRRQGANYVGLCPWHDDSRPSFQVNPTRQSWRCWVCDLGGDVFSFVMKRETIEFREALELLADRAGIVLPSKGRSTAGQDKRTLFKLLAWSERQFHDYLRDAAEAEPARQYLRDRGITDDSIQRFRLGFSPDRWDWLLQRARRDSFTDEQLKLTGLTSSTEASGRMYDRFRHRILFSIRDPQSRTVGFGGRVLPGDDEQPGAKYVNSPETRLFSKSHLLYGLDIVRDEVTRRRQVVVVEGYTDVIMLHQSGVHNAVAVLGTALTAQHIALLKRYCDRVTLVLDGDEAGQRRTNEILQLFLQHALDLRIATLPEGHDPCDFVQQYGGDAFESLVENAKDALNYRVDVVTAGLDIARDLHGANQAVEEILRAIAQLDRSRSGDVTTIQLKERQVLAQLTRRFDITEADLRARLRAMRANRSSPMLRGEAPSVAPVAKAAMDDWDRELLQLFVATPAPSLPAMVACVSERIDEVHLQSDEARQLYSLYRRRNEEGKSLAFKDVMLAVEAPETKSLLVELDEAASKKAELRNQPDACLEALLQAFARRDLKGQSRSEIRRLQNEPLSEAEQLEALQNVLNNQRSQQGIQAPMDG